MKLAGKKQNINPMWKVLNKDVDSLVDHVYLVCTQRLCEIRKDTVLTVTEPCLTPEFPQEQLKNYHAWKICVFLRGPAIRKVMPRNVWNENVSWRTKRLDNSTKYQLHALTTIVSKKKN